MSADEYMRVRETHSSNVLDDNGKVDDVGESVTRHVELVDLTEKSRGSGEPMMSLTSSYLRAKDDGGKYDDYALLLRRKANKDGDETSTTLEVRSASLRRALKQHLPSYGHLNPEACPIEVKKLYDALFHYRQEIREFASSSERNPEEKSHMEVLVKFLDSDLRTTERIYTQMVPNGLVDFEYLWTIFRAEDVLLAQTDHYRQCYRVISCGTKEVGNETFFEIHAWSWGYNGYKYDPVESRLAINEFSIPRRTTLLPYFPLRFLPLEEQQFQERTLVERGKRWRELVNVSHWQYEGPVWIDPVSEKAKKESELVMDHMSGRIMLKHRSHEREDYSLATSLHGSGGTIMSPSARAVMARWGYLPIVGAAGSINPTTKNFKGSLNDMKCHENDNNYQITEEQALLTPARTRNLSLVSKKWAFFLVEYVEEVCWSDTAFSKLEIDPTLKNYVRSLAESHSSEDTGFDDLIAGKGKGLVMLASWTTGDWEISQPVYHMQYQFLFGMLAYLETESIADFTRKPLYHLGAGGLGTIAKHTESILARIFDLARGWGAILLLDEADCFLSKRTSDDMERNAFVTIFLRLLEYYQGILFLTTNRIDEFDPAFQSRIHLGIEYTEFDATRRACIWKDLLSRISCSARFDEETFARLGNNIPVNRREIKNLIRTTLAITRADGGLTEEALMTVYNLNLKRPIT